MQIPYRIMYCFICNACAGPTVAGMDWKYLNQSMASGILDAFGAVSVHPYRRASSPPDTALADTWPQLRTMIERYGKSPAQKAMPMISGEWGYTSAALPCTYNNRVSEVEQAAYLARMWLSNTLAGVAVSIFYDWHSDGSDPGVCEDNFGAVRNKPTGNAERPFATKPSYKAALTLQNALGDFDTFTGRIEPDNITPAMVKPFDVFVLRFGPESPGPGNDVGFAVWTNGSIAARSTCGSPVTDRRDYRGWSPQHS